MKRVQIERMVAGFALLGLVTAGCAKKAEETGAKAPGNTPAQNAANTAVPVDVAAVRTLTVSRNVEVTGSLAALQSVALTPKVNQRVVRVVGREGAPVRAGEIVVQQDTTDLLRQLQQAEANLASARANLSSAQANARAASVRVSQARTNANVQVTTSWAGVRDAEEQLRSAQANLALTRNPQRSQEVTVAENNVKQAQANFDKARTDRERYEALVKEGAAAQITLDQYVTQEKVARAALDSAQQQLEIAREGGRAEQIRTAETQVARAQANLRQAKANQQQVTVRQDDVRAAQATLAQANAAAEQAAAAVRQQEATVALSRQAVDDAAIRSPIDGVISERRIEPGQIAAPGTTVVTVVSLDTVFFEAQVPETDVRFVRQGQTVEVRLDAFPRKAFNGTISRVYPTGSQTSRIFNARVEIRNTENQLRPGLFARGEIVAERRDAVTVPVEAVVTDPIGSLDATEAQAALENTRVYVVANGVAQERKVTQGLISGDGKRVEVTGVREGEQVVVGGQRGLKDGAKVTIHQEDRQGQQQAQAGRSAQPRL
ncbi:MAG: efflux RND transporter periplasmic adaptor subunit [Capsulimonadales bacterium]|nr:efflux RND transporter periplasmic adaptor subunit [Capsulimonadales bacterium]